MQAIDAARLFLTMSELDIRRLKRTLGDDVILRIQEQVGRGPLRAEGGEEAMSTQRSA